MDSSDDELDLIGRTPSTTADNIANARPISNEINDNDAIDEEEEVLTSDPDELAEIVASRSLEKYSGFAFNPSKPASAGSVSKDEKNNILPAPSCEVNYVEGPLSPFNQTRSPQRPLTPSSSPGPSSPESMGRVEEEMCIDAPDNSQPALLPSSPDSMRRRYSPPPHLQRLPIPQGVQGRETIGAQSDHSMDDLTALSPVEPLIGNPPSEDERPDSRALPHGAVSASELPLSKASSIHSPSPSPSTIPKLTHPRAHTPILPPSPRALSSPIGENSPGSPSNPEPSPDIPAELPYRRTLRARTARQQHPYAIEYAHYKRSMHKAGLDDAIVKLQARERQEAGNGNPKHPQRMDSEMQGFIVPEDEESQDLYIPPPPTPPRAQRIRSEEARQPSMDMDGLLAGFGGMISDDDAPTGRPKDKNKGKETAASISRKPRPKPFPHIGRNSPRKAATGASVSTPPPGDRSSTGGEERNNQTATPRNANQPSDPGSSSQPDSAGSGQSSTDNSDSGLVDSLERKRLRILNRMMPAAWVRRQMENANKQDKNSGSKNRRAPPNTENTGIKRNLANLQRPLLLVGDPESEEDAPVSPAQSPTEGHSTSRATPSPRRAQAPKRSRVFPRRVTQVLSDDNGNDIVEVSSSDEDRRSLSAGILTQSLEDDDEISTWLTRKSPIRSRSGGGGGGGGDLINRMMNRTRGPTHDSERKSRKTRTGYDRDGNKLKQAKLTSMFRNSSPDNEVVEISSDDSANTSANTSRRKAKNKGASRGAVVDHAKSQRAFTISADWAELLDATIAPNVDSGRKKDKKAAYNRTASTSNLHIRDGPARFPIIQNGQPANHSATAQPFAHKSISTDCGILPFKAHTKFSLSSYIGRGFLQNLIDVASASNTTHIETTPSVVFGEHLDTRLTGMDFIEQMRRLTHHWSSWLIGQNSESEQNVQRSFRFVSLRVTELLTNPPDNDSQANLEFGSTPPEFLEEDAAEIFAMARTISQGDPALKDATLESNKRWLSFHWFTTELAVRVACGNRRRALRVSDSAQLDSTSLDMAVQLLIRALLSYNISDRIRRAYNLVDEMDDPVLEIWVCLLYLIDDTEFAGATGWKPLWARVESILDTLDFNLSYKVFESERRWEHIFAFSALGAFSCQTGRLLPLHPPIARWQWVCKTIKDIRLKEDGVIAGANSRQQRIDFYVRVVTARCWLLHTMWGWNYQRPDRLLYLLHPIFQSRALAKLRDEKTDFPLFIRHMDLDHLERFSHGDTAWSIFLKIFRRSIVDDPSGARKLYSICTPIGVLNFTNENPATDLDLSRLFNRFSIFLVILITDPTQERATDCIKRIQALISFQMADMRSREACIRAFQYTGLLMKHYKLDLAPLRAWMHNMIQSLQTDMKTSTLLPQRNRLTVLVLCLVRSVAAIVSTCGFDRDTTREYPETALLTPDLIQVVFQLDLKSNAAARREIRLFLEAFCHAREAFMATLPPKPVPAPIVAIEEESQESYGFDEFELDLNDPEVLAGLDAFEGGADPPDNSLDPLVSKEKHTAEIVNTVISPAIFERIILGFGLDDRRLSGTPERTTDLGEEYAWVQVWVACLKIVVENHQRTWWDYLSNWGSAKQERISRIIDVAAERRVRLQFCYLALKCTPSLAQKSSKEQKHELILSWFQCLPHHRFTVEHKYTALICDTGLNSNPILDGLPCRKNDKGEHFVLITELMTERIDYVKCVLANLSRRSQAPVGGTSEELTRGRACIAKLFETMKHTWEHLSRQFASSADQDLLPSYLEFCHGVRRLTEELLVEPSVKDLCSRLAWVPASA